MELNELTLQGLLADEDLPIDEETIEDEVVEEDPLGLSEFSDNSEETEETEENKDVKDVKDVQENTDFIISYLKENGIEDPTKIQFENESGEIEEKDFNTLTDEEKLNILKELSNPGYTDYEKEVINYLRDVNMPLDKIIEYYQNKAIEDYLNENPDKVHQRKYSIDDYTDDEIYLADLKSKYPDFTDEELTFKLDSAKNNEDLFNKEVAAIRAQQKQIEEEEQQRQEEEQNQSYQQLQETLQTALGNFNEILLDPDDPQSDALQIEDSDKAVMLQYLIERGKDGKSQLVKDLEDPNALIELAYYRTRERDNLTGLTRYWKNVLSEERKEKAKLQKELDKYKNKEEDSFVVTKPKSQNKPASKKPKTIFDIYG